MLSVLFPYFLFLSSNELYLFSTSSTRPICFNRNSPSYSVLFIIQFISSVFLKYFKDRFMLVKHCSCHVGLPFFSKMLFKSSKSSKYGVNQRLNLVLKLSNDSFSSFSFLQSPSPHKVTYFCFNTLFIHSFRKSSLRFRFLYPKIKVSLSKTSKSFNSTLF